MATPAAIARRTSFALCAAGLAASSIWWAPPAYTRIAHATTRPAAEAKKVDTWTVTRGQLRITFTESGKLRAIKSYPIIPQISRQQLKISFLATEGAQVKKGDLVVSFDKKAFEDLLQTKKAELEGATRQKTVDQAALEIAQTTADAAVKQAKAKYKEAQVALKTYQELDGPKKLNDLETSINENRGKLTTADKTLVDAKQKLDDGLFSEEAEQKNLQRQLSDAQENSRTLKKTLDSLVLQRKIFRQYDYPQTLDSKHQAVEGANTEVTKALVSGRNDVNQKQAALAKTDDTIRRLNREINDLNDNIKKCDLTAPVAGLIVYGDPSNPYRYYGNEIKVGAEWYGGNTLMTIPDLSAFEIDLGVPEDYVGKIKPGLPVTVTFEAVPGSRLTGSLKEIAKLGQPRDRWDPSSPRQFPTIVTLNGSDPRLVSGMTGRVEILADQVDNALLIPTDAVATENGKTICMVRTDNNHLDRREVKTGRSNNSFVEILSGLSDNEKIALGAALESVGNNNTASAGPTTLPTAVASTTTQPTTAPTIAKALPTTLPTHKRATSQPTTKPTEAAITAADPQKP